MEVAEHKEHEHVVVIEGDVEDVGQLHRPEAGLGDVGEGGVGGQQLTADARRVEDDEKAVAEPGGEERGGVIEVKAVVEVAGALGDGPGDEEHGHADGAAGRGHRYEDAPNENQTGENLNEGGHRGGGHKLDGRVHHFNQLNGLEGGDDGGAVLPQQAKVGGVFAARCEELKGED